jgi:hypothetical protein
MGWTTKGNEILANYRIQRFGDMNIRATFMPYNCIKTHINPRNFRECIGKT